MNNELKEELLYRIKMEPKFLGRIRIRYNLDLDFYRKAVSHNIDSFLYIPDEYKEDEEIVNIILKTASTSYLNFPFNNLKVSTRKQKMDLVKIKTIICYIKLYKLIYEKEKKFEKETIFSMMNDNDPLIKNINCIVGSLDELERNYIVYRYGLIDGCIKVNHDISSYFGIGYVKICELERDSFTKMKEYVSSYGNITNRFK